MAKKGGSGKTYTSKGEVPTTNKKTLNAIRRDYMGSQDRILNQMKALAKGKDVVFTFPNPNKNETNKPFIRQRVSGRDYVKRMQGKA